jgi:hypothetical protein
MQKGFEQHTDGVLEHTELLAHIMRTAKAEQRSLCISLLDLRNAFGLIEHAFIRHSLSSHHVPVEVIKLFNSIYKNSRISIAVGDEWTEPVEVLRSVLQGDPLSPVLFNLCVNTFQITINQPDMMKLGFSWGRPNQRSSISWLQYADDAIALAPDVRAMQQLLTTFESWCQWSGMAIRLDKCISLGMQKRNGAYCQYKPNLSLAGGYLPAVEINGSFSYLGRLFDFEGKDNVAKSLLEKNFCKCCR